MKRTTRIARMSLEAAIGENVRLGLLEVWGVNEHGEPLYRITPEGEQHVRDLIESSAGTEQHKPNPKEQQ